MLGHLKAGVDNICAGATPTYQHVDSLGPRHTRVSVREDEEQEAELCWLMAGSWEMTHSATLLCPAAMSTSDES